MTRRLIGSAFAVALAVLAFGACSGADKGGPLKAGYGRLSVDLVDAPNPTVKEIVVTIGKVTAHSTSAGWVTVMQNTVTVDLLKLQTESQQLGFNDLPAGKITQIRLYVVDGPRYVTLEDGSHVDLKVPSGYQSGIKINGPFELDACNQTGVTLDFDGHKSIWVHPTGQGDEWILRPVIHAKKVVGSNIGCETSGSSGSSGTFQDSSGGGDCHGNGHSHGCQGTSGGSTGTSGDTTGGSTGTTTGGSSGTTGSTTCSTNSDCPTEIPVCDQGACKQGSGTSCTAGSACASGSCDATGQCAQGGAGQACAAPTDCYSGLCDGSTQRCLPGGPGAPCAANTDCASGTCGTDGVCGSGTAGHPGAACSSDADCLSNNCTSGACQQGIQGTPCSADTDCVTGLTCNGGSCGIQMK